MLLKIQDWGGICPKILDPSLLAPNRSQNAVNVRFDRGGITPLSNDLLISGETVPVGTKTIFVYYQPKSPPTPNILSWITDVDVVKSPVPNDKYNRIYYTENGILKATGLNPNEIKMESGEFYYPCPPAPNSPMTVTLPEATPGSGNLATVAELATSYEYESGYTIEAATPSPDKALQAVPIATQFFKTKLGFNQLLNNGNGWWQYDLGDANGYSINTLTMWYDDGQTATCGPGTFTVLASVDPTFQIAKDEAGNPKTVILFATPTNLGTGSGSQWGGSFLVDGITFTWITPSKVYRYIRILVTSLNDPKSPGKPLQINAIQLSWNPPVPDATLAQTKAFTYTLVNEYGQEGPPWVAGEGQSQIIAPFYEGNVLTFVIDRAWMNQDTGQEWDPLYKLYSARIYLSNETSSGTNQFQLVTEIKLKDPADRLGLLFSISIDHTHEIYSSSLGVVCPSSEWSQPPGYVSGIPVGDGSQPGLHGLISLAGGILAGFSGNVICFSVPNFPHAWPVTQQYVVDTDIVALGAYGTTVIALTNGQPYLAVGNDPANIVMEKIGDALACLSKRGVVSVSGITVYSTPEGLKAIGPNIDELLTKDLITKEQWNVLIDQSDLHSYYWDGKYLGFWTYAGVTKGFMLDLKTKDLVMLLDSQAIAGYFDPTNGRLNYVYVPSGSVSPLISAFNEGSGYKTADYKTKKFKFQKTSFSCIKVLANAYPVYVEVGYPGVPISFIITVTSEEPQRLPYKILVDEAEINPFSTITMAQVSAILLASTLEEMPI